MAGLEPLTTLLSRVRRTLVAAKKERNAMRKVMEDLHIAALTGQPMEFLVGKTLNLGRRTWGGGGGSTYVDPPLKSLLYTS